MKLILPILFTLTTALTTFWYANYTQKYNSLFLVATIDAFCFLAIAVFAYYREGTSAIAALRDGITESYTIPYVLLTVIYGCLWYFLTSQKGVAYTSVYESSYILLLVLLGVWFKQETFDVRFFIGASLVCIGIIIIEYK